MNTGESIQIVPIRLKTRSAVMLEGEIIWWPLRLSIIIGIIHNPFNDLLINIEAKHYEIEVELFYLTLQDMSPSDSVFDHIFLPLHILIAPQDIISLIKFKKGRGGKNWKEIDCNGECHLSVSFPSIISQFRKWSLTGIRRGMSHLFIEFPEYHTTS